MPPLFEQVIDVNYILVVASMDWLRDSYITYMQETRKFIKYWPILRSATPEPIIAWTSQLAPHIL